MSLDVQESISELEQGYRELRDSFAKGLLAVTLGEAALAGIKESLLPATRVETAMEKDSTK
jgi:hypothetical protein